MDLLKLTAVAQGAPGAAGGSALSTPVSGIVHKVRLEYGGSPPATTDVTLQDENDTAAENIVNRTNSASNTTIYPRRQVQSAAGANLTYDGVRGVYENYLVCGRLKLTIAQANEGSSVTAVVYLIRL